MDNENDLIKRLKLAAMAGGLSGAGVAGIGGLLSGAKGASVLKAALSGGAVGGVSAPAAIGAGELVMGSPDKSEKNPNSRRGLMGGALMGGLAGAGAGALMRNKAILSKLGSLGKKAEGAIDSDNFLFNKMRELVNQKEKSKIAGGIGLGALSGAAAGGYLGADEGIGIDAVQNELDNMKRRREKKKLLEHQGLV